MSFQLGIWMTQYFCHPGATASLKKRKNSIKITKKKKSSTCTYVKFRNASASLKHTILSLPLYMFHFRLSTAAISFVRVGAEQQLTSGSVKMLWLKWWFWWMGVLLSLSLSISSLPFGRLHSTVRKADVNVQFQFGGILWKRGGKSTPKNICVNCHLKTGLLTLISAELLHPLLPLSSTTIQWAAKFQICKKCNNLL